MKLRNKLLERIGIQAEPRSVEKASRKERVKRNAWMTFTTLLSAILALFLILLTGFVLPSWLLESNPAGFVFMIVFLFTTFWIDMRIFSWGVHRFNLVVPWQFREEKAKAGTDSTQLE